MNILFLTLANLDIKNRGIYSDLMRCFATHGHSLYIVSPIERRNNQPTSLTIENDVRYLRVRTLNIQKTNMLEKGVATLLLESQFCHAIKRHFSDVQFDIVLYSTPPITFANVLKYVKKNSPKVICYLLLKDIFPQNAVDLGMFSKKGLIYQYFRRKEEQLYKLSDYIGCMSPANVEYILKHNPSINPNNVEVAPNSVEITPATDETAFNRDDILRKYNIPIHKTILIYGGNLGKPQGIPFLVQCLEVNKNRKDCHFVIVGNGTEYTKLLHWYEDQDAQNITILKALPKKEYDKLVMASDVGLIFLDYHFTIPNFPSRLLPYMQYHMPIIAATDPNTDIGTIAEENHFGLACHSNDVESFTQCVNKMLESDIRKMGDNAYEYLCSHYTVEHTYKAVISHIKN